MSGGRIVVSIERLSVDGSGSSDAARLGAALERELTSLLRERGVPVGLRSATAVREIALDTSGVPAVATPETQGRALAQAIHARLERPLGGWSSNAASGAVDRGAVLPERRPEVAEDGS